jgi:hypothetical protein
MENQKIIPTITGIIIILVEVVILFGGIFVYQYLAQQQTKKPEVNSAKITPAFSFAISDDGNKGVNLAIANKMTGGLVQTINIPYIDLSFYKTLTATDFANNNDDINFDGYKDLQVLVNIPGDNPGGFDFYIYNPSTGKFDADKNLQMVSGPTFDPKTKTITSYASGGCAGGDFAKTTLTFINGDYSITENQIGNCCPAWDKNSSVKVEEYKNGKVVSTTQEACPPQ